jgi:hypothetical protein
VADVVSLGACIGQPLSLDRLQQCVLQTTHTAAAAAARGGVRTTHGAAVVVVAAHVPLGSGYEARGSSAHCNSRACVFSDKISDWIKRGEQHGVRREAGLQMVEPAAVRWSPIFGQPVGPSVLQ